MKDFTKKGTKLPVIPVGTEYLTGLIERKWESHYCKKPLYSHGKTLRRGEVYIKAEKKNFNQNDNFYLIKLSTIERLAKEQGMWDDGITMTFKQYEPFRVLELQPDLKVTFPCGHEITIQTNQFLTTTDCEQCKTNQMNPTITLQENGDVIISNTETTTTLSKVTVDEICRLVKEDREKVKKPNLQLGKWYKVINLQYGCLGFPDIGFFTDEKHTDGICVGIDGFNLKTINGRVWRVNGDFAELPPETVQQYLTDEFIRLGGKVGAKVECLALKESVETITSMDFYFEQSENCLWVQSNTDCSNKGACIFDNGKFATIIKPETITRAEAEKRLGKVITD